jgi:hypothetical protein
MGNGDGKDEEGIRRLKDIFGEPRTGVHAMRIPILDIALVDTALTVLLALCIAHIFKLSIWKTIVGVFVLGTIIHAVVGVRTKITVTVLRLLLGTSHADNTY